MFGQGSVFLYKSAPMDRFFLQWSPYPYRRMIIPSPKDDQKRDFLPKRTKHRRFLCNFAKAQLSKEVGVVKEDKEVKGDKDNRKKRIGSSSR